MKKKVVGGIRQEIQGTIVEPGEIAVLGESRIGKKWQVVIPFQLRKTLDLKIRDGVQWVLFDDNKIRFYKVVPMRLPIPTQNNYNPREGGEKREMGED